MARKCQRQDSNPEPLLGSPVLHRDKVPRAQCLRLQWRNWKSCWCFIRSPTLSSWIKTDIITWILPIGSFFLLLLLKGVFKFTDCLPLFTQYFRSPYVSQELEVVIKRKPCFWYPGVCILTAEWWGSWERLGWRSTLRAKRRFQKRWVDSEEAKGPSPGHPELGVLEQQHLYPDGLCLWLASRVAGPVGPRICASWRMLTVVYQSFLYPALCLSSHFIPSGPAKYYPTEVQRGHKTKSNRWVGQGRTWPLNLALPSCLLLGPEAAWALGPMLLLALGRQPLSAYGLAALWVWLERAEVLRQEGQKWEYLSESPPLEKRIRKLANSSCHMLRKIIFLKIYFSEVSPQKARINQDLYFYFYFLSSF